MMYDIKRNNINWPWTESDQKINYSKHTNWPRISIVTPSYNQGQFIEETIRSVLLQGYPNLEYIIIDGGSNDNTVETIKHYGSQLAYWISEPDSGQSHAINKGFDKATGDILAWLNSDDIYLPGALFHIADVFLRNKVDWIVGITLVTDKNLKTLDRFVPLINTGNWKAKGYKMHGWLDFVITHQSGTALPQPASFWSKRAILSAGKLDESFKYAMDHDLYGRLAYLGYRPKLIPHTIACFRIQPQQKTSSFPVPFWREELRSVNKWKQLDLTLDERRVLNEYEMWFTWRIRFEQLKISTGLKRLNAIFWDKGSTLNEVFRKIILLFLKIFKNCSSTQKGVINKDVIAQYLPKNPVIIEAGAHIGFDTEELARRFPEGTIYAFEPVPDIFKQLVERTHPYKNVHCIPFALSDKVGYFMMYVSSGLSDGSSSLFRPKSHLKDHPDVIFDKTIHVPCITLDYWMKTTNIEKVDLLWLDMQGYELNALKAGTVVLESALAIYTEVNLKEVYEGAPLYGELRDWLEAHNYKVVTEELSWEDSGNVLFVRNNI
jgi:FkbM family methyltransferase